MQILRNLRLYLPGYRQKQRHSDEMDQRTRGWVRYKKLRSDSKITLFKTLKTEEAKEYTD
jgi:hypothetical protein